MRARTISFLIVACCVTGLARAQPVQEDRDDRMLAEKHGWIYNNLAKGYATAKATGKPLMVVIRCPP